MNPILHKLRWLTRRSRREADLRDELQFHLEQEAAEALAAGLAADPAKWAARRELGNIALLMEDTRAAWGWASVERSCQDLRYALRTLSNSPGFAAAVVVSLALGIGANTAIFSLLNAVVMRPLPVPAPLRLVQFTNTLPLWETAANNWNSWFAYPQLENFQAHSKTLSGIFGGTGLGRITVGLNGASGLAHGDAYTGNFFSVLGIAPQYGRLFSPADDAARAPVAVISDAWWRSRFGADPTIVGRAVTVNQIPFTVIGITPRDFQGISVGNCPDIWVPLHALDRLKPDARRWTEPWSSWLLIAGRLRPGMSRQQAQAELDGMSRQFLADVLPASELAGEANVQRFVRDNRLALRGAASGMHSGLRDLYAFPLQLLMGVAGIVLLVACANIANLLLARASNRRREIAVRLALGASPPRILCWTSFHALRLAVVGVAFGALGGWASARLLRDLVFGIQVRNPETMVAAAVAVLAIAFVAAAVPSWRAARVDAAHHLHQG